MAAPTGIGSPTPGNPEPYGTFSHPALPLGEGSQVKATPQHLRRTPAGGTERAGDAFTEGTSSQRRVPQRQQRPLLACRRQGSWGCTLGPAPAHAHPPPPTLRPLPRPDNASGPATPLRTRPGLPPPPHSPVLCCPASPLPRGPSGCSYLRPSSIRLSSGRPGARPSPLPARVPRGQRMLRPLPARRCPPAAAPPGAEDSAFARRAPASRRVWGGPSGGGGGKAGGADPGSPGRRLRSPRQSRAELSGSGASGPAPGGNKRGRRWGGRGRAGPGAAGVRRAIARPRVSRAAARRRKGAGGRKTPPRLVHRS